MGWRKAKRLLQCKPYLLDPYRCRSTNAAKRMLATEGIPSAEKVLSGARIRAGKNASEWEAFTGMPSKKMESKCKQATPVRFGKLFMLSRRAVIAISILIVLMTFIACTPTGRAWAVAAYNAIVEVIDGILYVRAEKRDGLISNEPAVPSVEESVIGYGSINEALEQIDAPILYMPADIASPDSLQLISNPLEGAYFESTYSLDDNVKITIKQDWGNRLEDSIILDDSKQYTQILLSNGMTVDGVYSSDDFIFIGTAISEGTVIHIFAANVQNIVLIQKILSTLILG